MRGSALLRHPRRRAFRPDRRRFFARRPLDRPHRARCLSAIIGDRVTVGRNAGRACLHGRQRRRGGRRRGDPRRLRCRRRRRDRAGLDRLPALGAAAGASSMPACRRDRCAISEPARSPSARRDARRGSKQAQARCRRPRRTALSSHAVFVAATAQLRGRIVAAENSSIWFGCDLDANGGEIIIGERTNIQDNTSIRCRPGRASASARAPPSATT